MYFKKESENLGGLVLLTFTWLGVHTTKAILMEKWEYLFTERVFLVELMHNCYMQGRFMMVSLLQCHWEISNGIASDSLESYGIRSGTFYVIINALIISVSIVGIKPTNPWIFGSIFLFLTILYTLIMKIYATTIGDIRNLNHKVTEIKREAKHKHMINSIDMGIIVFKNGFINYRNKAAKKWLSMFKKDDAEASQDGSPLIQSPGIKSEVVSEVDAIEKNKCIYLY